MVATCTSAVDALRIVRAEPIDLVFLEIEMPGLDGIGFIEALTRPPRFVFTTAHRDYAVAGFELDAVDYLLKPVTLPRLLRALDKYRGVRLAEQRPSAGEADPADPAALHLRVDRRTVRVDVAEIRYVESPSDYVNVCAGSHTYTSKMRITDLEAELRPHEFIRIHRSFIVAIRHVDVFTSREVVVGETIPPVSRTYRDHALDRLQSSTG